MNSDELSGNHADFVDNNNNNFQIDTLCYSFNLHVETSWTNTVNLSRIGMQSITFKSLGLLSISPGIILPIQSTGH